MRDTRSRSYGRVALGLGVRVTVAVAVAVTLGVRVGWGIRWRLGNGDISDMSDMFVIC